MAGLASVLKALAAVVWRELQTQQSVAQNNFFLFCFLLLGSAGTFLQIILGLVLLFPLTVDPLAKIPRQRLALWPFTPRQRVSLRIASFGLSPALWITLGLLAWASRHVLGGSFALLAIPCLGLNAVLGELPKRFPAVNPLRYLPPLPGQLGGLIRKNLREMLMVLDVYPGVIMTLCGGLYRLVRRPEPDALMMLSLLVVLTLSTYAQRLFALDAAEIHNRYALLPLHGWQVLFAKDAAFLLLALVLVLPLAPLAGMAAALMALAVGHHASVRQPLEQARWHFTGGASIVTSALQTVLMFGAGTAVFRQSAWWLAPCVAAYAMSLAWFGQRKQFLVGEVA